MSTALLYALNTGDGLGESQTPTFSANSPDKLKTLLGLLALRPDLYGEALAEYRERMDQIEKGNRKHPIGYRFVCLLGKLFTKITGVRFALPKSETIDELCLNVLESQEIEADPLVRVLLFELLRNYLNPDLICSRLYWCAIRNQHKTLRTMLSMLNPGERKYKKKEIDNGLYAACLMENIECVKTLIEFGADANSTTDEEDYKKNDYAATCLLAAIFSGIHVHTTTGLALPWERTDLVQLLLEAGADPLVKGFDGLDALGRAKKFGRVKCEQLISDWIANHSKPQKRWRFWH